MVFLGLAFLLLMFVLFIVGMMAIGTRGIAEQKEEAERNAIDERQERDNNQ